VVRITENLRTAEAQKNVMTVRQTYPTLFGEHMVRSQDGEILDGKAKSATDIFVLFPLYERRSTGKNLIDTKVADAFESLRKRNYKVFSHSLQETAVSGNSVRPVANIGADMCRVQGVGLEGPPCILYFKPSLRDKALEIEGLVSPAQAVSDDRIRYVDPTTMLTPYQQLIGKAGLDIIVVLGAN